MTPPAAAAESRSPRTGAPRTRTRRATPPPRRVSGPARGRAATTVSAPPPLALRLGGAVHGLAEHRLLDRVIRGHAWIAILGIGLIGIVFMQVSMLRMNAGIGEAVQKAGTLERENAATRATISELSSGDRIEAEAAKLGLVLPSGTPRFLDARGFDARRALTSIRRPGEIEVASLAAAPELATTTPTLAATGVAPSTAPSTATTTATTEPAPAGTTAPPTTTSTTNDPAATRTQAAQPAAAPATTAAPVTATATGGADASGQVTG